MGVWFLAFFYAGEIYEYQDTVDGVHLPEVDAIVCLAGGRGRIAAAGDLWLRYWEHQPKGELKVPLLYVSGMGQGSTWNTVARQVRGGVKEVLSPEQVILETESSNTEENGRFLFRYAYKHGWKRILLITSRYHMRRSRYIFSRVLNQSDYPLEIETLSVYQEPFEPGEWRQSVHGTRVTMTEYLKWLYYRAFWKPANFDVTGLTF